MLESSPLRWQKNHFRCFHVAPSTSCAQCHAECATTRAQDYARTTISLIWLDLSLLLNVWGEITVYMAGMIVICWFFTVSRAFYCSVYLAIHHAVVSIQALNCVRRYFINIQVSFRLLFIVSVPTSVTSFYFPHFRRICHLFHHFEPMRAVFLFNPAPDQLAISLTSPK